MTIRASNPSYSFGPSSAIVNQTSGLGSFTTIQGAVTASQLSGGATTIYIQPGTYTESIAWPSGLSIIAASTGNYLDNVEIVGNQTFSATGASAFNNITFSSTSGDTFLIGNSGAGSSSIEMNACSVMASAGNAVRVFTSSGTGALLAYDCSLTGSANGLQLGLNSNGNTTTCVITSTAGDAVNVGPNSIWQTFLDDITATAGNAVVLSGISAAVASHKNLYTCANSAFRFTSTLSLVESCYDEIISSNGTGFFASSSGAFGTLLYSYITLQGTAQNLDPQIAATAYQTEPPSSSGSQSWTDVGTSQAVVSGSAYFATAAITLTLPSSPSQSNAISFISDTSSTIVIQAPAGQFIRLGNQISISGGTATSSAQGDSLTLVYRSSDTTWIAQQFVGDWLVT